MLTVSVVRVVNVILRLLALFVLRRFFFFFQAEDGIRDYKVTGVQTCALPICRRFQLPLTQLRTPIGLAFTGFVWLCRPVGEPALRVYARLSPPGDRLVFARPEVRAMFLDDLLRGAAKGVFAPVLDIVLFGRH